ncbi:MAG: class I SAM-dependent methyltransferase [Bacteroidales bacterium]|nr:class I SAM-dependent methyltransferase [Bacteroidales bacterium]
MQERHNNRRLYFEELALTSSEFYLKYINKFKKIDNNLKILEIGCGEGGNLLPFAEKGCFVAGMDLSETKINAGNEYFAALNFDCDLVCCDFFDYKSAHKFDIIIIHDVIEHIPSDKKQEFMRLTITLLESDGIIFIAFPPWQMPFGGHQQICRSIISTIPFIHLLPLQFYTAILRLSGENDDCIKELLSIREAKMSIEKFEKLYKFVGLRCVDRTIWFINPHYKQKFGLMPRKQNNIISHLPYIRNYFTTSCFYVLQM